MGIVVNGLFCNWFCDFFYCGVYGYLGLDGYGLFILFCGVCFVDCGGFYWCNGDGGVEMVEIWVYLNLIVWGDENCGSDGVCLIFLWYYIGLGIKVVFFYIGFCNDWYFDGYCFLLVRFGYSSFFGCDRCCVVVFGWFEVLYYFY